MKETTTIRTQKKTKVRLESYGRMNESFDDLINRILDELDKRRKQ